MSNWKDKGVSEMWQLQYETRVIISEKDVTSTLRFIICATIADSYKENH